MLANEEPFWSSASFVAAAVWPLKNFVQSVMIAADTAEFTLGALVVVAAVVLEAAVVAVGIVVMEELGGFEDPHAASRIDATPIPASASQIRELRKRVYLSNAPGDVMVTIIASSPVLAREPLRKSANATSVPSKEINYLLADVLRHERRGDLGLFVGRVTACFPTVGFLP
jgi:hypothetical protein